MESMNLTITLGVFLFVGFTSLYKGIVNYRRRAMIVDIPRSNIYSLAMGLVEIHGTVRDAHECACIFTPFSKTKSVHYSYRVEELRGGKNSKWVTIAEGARSVKFVAFDETGEVVVDPAEAEFKLEVHREYKHDSGFFEGISRFWTDYQI